MPTFLHIADVHLDSAFSAHLDTHKSTVRRGEVRRSLSNILDRARDVDILLIAGDLFDGKNVSPETVAFLKRKFAEIKNTRVFIVAGNHDPYTDNSVYANEDFGENVHIFKTEAECVDIPELKTRIYGVSFKSEYECEKMNLLIEPQEGYSNIILLHADLTSIGGESRYNPIDKNFIADCGADYLALGHIHKRSEVLRAGKTYYAYSGTTEGHGFDECGDMGYYIGEISHGVANVGFERSCIRRMFIVDTDITGVSDNLGAAELVRKKIQETGTADDMYRVILKGRTDKSFLNLGILKEELKPHTSYIEIKDETAINYDIDEIAEQNTLCGEFVRIMRNREKTADDDITAEATALGIEMLLGGGV